LGCRGGAKPRRGIRGGSQDGRSTTKEIELAEQRKHRKFSAQQKLEIVLAGLRGDRSVRDVCREHEVAETLYYAWRDKILEGGKSALAGKDERQGEKELQKRIRELERTLGRKTYELEIAGEALRGWE
ncbi:MAG: transposase, partial [Solirubrobacterales bacterium]